MLEKGNCTRWTTTKQWKQGSARVLARVTVHPAAQLMRVHLGPHLHPSARPTRIITPLYSTFTHTYVLVLYEFTQIYMLFRWV